MIKILIADDHAVVREGLKKILAEAKDMDVCGEASDGMSALLLMRSQNWDVVLLDISMPGKNGLDVLKAIRAEKSELRIVMLSIYPESQYALRCLKAGASGYLTKESAPGQLIVAIRKVAKGGKYISTELAEKLVSELTAPSERLLHEALSDRELEILRLMATGHSPAQIAEILFISSKTVSTYRSRLLRKMNMRSNAELISYAIKNNLIY
jgi:two-component system, NarL family, invasion response regulator UvrY